jgi:hypothetical protein
LMFFGLWQDPVAYVVATPPTAQCKTANVMPFQVSWSAGRAIYGCFARSEEHHEVGHRSAIPPELRERVRRWHQRMVDTETGTCMHMRHILLNPGDFRFLSRQQNGRSYPSYACIGRTCLCLFLGLHVWHLCDICVILQFCFRWKLCCSIMLDPQSMTQEEGIRYRENKGCRATFAARFKLLSQRIFDSCVASCCIHGCCWTIIPDTVLHTATFFLKPRPKSADGRPCIHICILILIYMSPNMGCAT